jgi:hypothetical protein
MGTPVPTTTVTVTRNETAATDGLDPYDPYDPTSPTTVTTATGVRATIGSPQASVALSGGDRVTFTAQLVCDVCDLKAGDTLTDAGGTAWYVMWARRTTELGFSHIQGELRLVTGAT